MQGTGEDRVSRMPARRAASKNGKKAAAVRGHRGPKATRSPAQPRSWAERYAAGKALRESCPRASHASWKAPADRRDAVDLVLEAEKGRIAELLPLRHGRMVRSPFTFYRGAALTMAADLASTPTNGVRVQCCGDAHLCNFGGFATPERRILFAINDLDETLPAPWEWDVKRLAASFVVACRDNGLRADVGQDSTLRCVRSYRESMAEFSQMKTLEVFHQAMWARDIVAALPRALRERVTKRIAKEQQKSRGEELFPKLVEHRGEMPVIRDQLPAIFHAPGHSPGEVQRIVLDAIAGYRATLPPSLQALLGRYELRDAAVKVVGVGSVGTSCWVLLFMAGEDDPLFLQVKQARQSVLEPYAGASVFANHGQRVVDGYRVMQPASDMFLGWTQAAGEQQNHFFFRQLRDIKISPNVETFGAADMEAYAQWCGRALALSHARSGQSARLAGYMGKSETFDVAIAAFAKAYADQNEKDHAAFARAIRKGTLKAVKEAGR
jgi:uncharacterized protein (DUF2252 family)